MLAEIRQAEQESGRPVGSVTLLPVTKGHPPELAREATTLGLTALGENYLQECVAKDRVLRDSRGPRVRWHLLGHLQRNKARRAAELFHLVESVDSLEVARRLSSARAGQPKLQVLCEVELTGLSQRTGFAPSRLREEFSQLLELEGIGVVGLMTVADPGNPERVFSACRELLVRLRLTSGQPLPTLSMGMSGDFRAAIAEGTTQVRIGTLLFGARPTANGAG